MKITIQGKVQAKQRPRFNGKFTYTPEQTKNYENWVKLSFINQYPNFKPLENELEVSIKAYFEIPKSVSKKKREQMLNGNIRPTIKPDLDNIAKSVLDALNGLAYLDDKQIVFLKVEKFYAESPRVELMVEEISYDEGRIL